VGARLGDWANWPNSGFVRPFPVYVWPPSCHGSRRRQAFYLKENKEHARTIFVILLVLWLLGLVTAYTFGGFVHLLLVVALVVLVIQLLQGRRVV
jgi:hypothetical protein